MLAFTKVSYALIFSHRGYGTCIYGVPQSQGLLDDSRRCHGEHCCLYRGRMYDLGQRVNIPEESRPELLDHGFREMMVLRYSIH